jgi:hypothetical protein
VNEEALACVGPQRQRKKNYAVESILFQFFTRAIGDLVGINNNNSIANCIFTLLRKSNQPEDGL